MIEQEDIWWIGEVREGHVIVLLQPPFGEWFCSCGDHSFGVQVHRFL